MDTILVIIGAIVAIICIVAIYYLLKLILGYVGFAIIGAVAFGVIGAVAAKFLFPANMIDITLYSAGAGALRLCICRAFVLSPANPFCIDCILLFVCTLVR